MPKKNQTTETQAPAWVMAGASVAFAIVVVIFAVVMTRKPSESVDTPSRESRTYYEEGEARKPLERPTLRTVSSEPAPSEEEPAPSVASTLAATVEVPMTPLDPTPPAATRQKRSDVGAPEPPELPSDPLYGAFEAQRCGPAEVLITGVTYNKWWRLVMLQLEIRSVADAPFTYQTWAEGSGARMINETGYEHAFYIPRSGPYGNLNAKDIRRTRKALVGPGESVVDTVAFAVEPTPPGRFLLLELSAKNVSAPSSSGARYRVPVEIIPWQH